MSIKSIFTIKSFTTKAFILISILILFNNTNSGFHSNTETLNNEYVPINNSISGSQYKWNTNDSVINVIIHNDWSTIEGNRTYNLTASFQTVDLSSNVTSLSGINLEIRLNYYFGLIDYNPIHFTSVNKSGMIENGTTEINVPNALKSTENNKNYTTGAFLYKLHFYEFLKPNLIKNYSTDWFAFSLTTIENISIIPVSISSTGLSFTIDPFVGIIFILGFLTLALVFILRNKTKDDKIKQKNHFLHPNFRNQYTQSDLSKEELLSEQSLNPGKDIIQDKNVDPLNTNLTSRYQTNLTSSINKPIPRFLCSNCNNMIKKNSQFCPECGVQIQRCNICQLPIEKRDESCICPHCNKMFHITHLIDSLKINEICPICKESLTEEQIRLTKTD